MIFIFKTLVLNSLQSTKKENNTLKNMLEEYKLSNHMSQKIFQVFDQYIKDFWQKQVQCLVIEDYGQDQLHQFKEMDF